MAGLGILASTVGIYASTLGIVNFFSGQFAQVDADHHYIWHLGGHTYKIQLGLDVYNGLDGGAGTFPSIRAWNENCVYVGGFATNDSQFIENGAHETVHIIPEDKHILEHQSPYTLHYAWVGDWAQPAGVPWFYSNVYINSRDYVDACMWLQQYGGDENKTSVTGFQIHWPSFYFTDKDLPGDKEGKDALKAKDYGRQIDLLRSEHHLHGDDEGSGNGTESAGISWPHGFPEIARNETRAVRKKRTDEEKSGGRLVVSERAQHLATTLCESETSLGPNFLNVAEGKFCHMT
ncbi:Uu.00g116000.m01.CDS01 [Anthostomella pinea]|uniref:Uu.00g116000.m01.CDS01 n=1 Tax=Anthostomella pinea TaxID=933095 RepID=A0AAI8VGG2_9PEZI|nr:Uu.00g116000.m01.CDS01 [Anthostomella pinea]